MSSSNLLEWRSKDCLANLGRRGGALTCGGNNAFSVFRNPTLQGCYSPNVPGVDATHSYVAPSDAGVSPDSGASSSSATSPSTISSSTISSSAASSSTTSSSTSTTSPSTSTASTSSTSSPSVQTGTYTSVYVT